jgi:hypothetical protein
MDKGRLPDEGPARIGAVTLPPGRLITGWHGNDHGVAWVTVDPVPDSGQAWAALSELHPQTDLVPIVLDGLPYGVPHDSLPDDALRPWDSGAFIPPEDPRKADGVDVGAFLRSEWRCWVPPRPWTIPSAPRCGRRSPGSGPVWPSRSTRR